MKSQMVLEVGNPIRAAFLFEQGFIFPPTIDNIKSFYVTEELLRRKVRVCWVQFKAGSTSESKDGIEFVTIPVRSNSKLIRPLMITLRFLGFCLARDIKLVYVDEWLMFRRAGFWQLFLRAVLKMRRIKIVFDQRDPYIDFELAYGRLKQGSRRHTILSLQYALIYRLTDIIILPSAAYANEYVRSGIPSHKVFGIPRGVDSKLFNPSADSKFVRSKLNLNGKFVIGWFGMMHRYRQINEVLIPLIKSVHQVIPNAHVLIGGRGELLERFVEFKNREPDAPFTLVGMIPYPELPSYIAACDVLLSPINPSFRFTKHSVWLKILESLAVGRPIIATRTSLVEGDFKNLSGVVWTGADVQSFESALAEVHEKYQYYSDRAMEQASNFREYTTSSTVSKLVDRLLSLFSV